MIYIHKNNQQIGPFDDDKIEQMFKDNQLSPYDMACRQGSSQWKPLMIVLSEGHPDSAIIEREFTLYDTYSQEMNSILQHWAEADDGTAKQLRKQYEQKLQIAERHALSMKQQYPNILEVKVMEADVFHKKAQLKLNERGFLNTASGSLLARGRRKSSLTSTTLGAATRMIANQQEKNNAMEAIRLFDHSLSIMDTPAARYSKAGILHF